MQMILQLMDSGRGIDDSAPSKLLHACSREPMTIDSGDEEEEFNVPPPAPKIRNYKEAIQSLEGIKIFLEDHGHFEQPSTAASTGSNGKQARIKLDTSNP